MSELHSDALVFFGATGDLAYKKIFPALQAMVRRGHLNVPVIGVAKAGWTLDQFKAGRATASRSTAASTRRPSPSCARLLRYVDGDYKDPATFAALRKELGSAQHPAHYLAIPPALFGVVVEQLGKSGCAPRRPRHRRKAVRHGPCLGAGPQPYPAGQLRRGGDLPHRPLPGQRSRCRTCSISASPTPSWSRSGTATTSRACRSPWRRVSACRAAAPSTRRPAPSATWSKTTCCRSSPTWRWSRRPGPTASRSATRRSRSSRPCRPWTRTAWCAGSSAATARRRGSRPIRRWRPSPRCGWRSTPGAGTGCRSTSGPASACP